MPPVLLGDSMTQLIAQTAPTRTFFENHERDPEDDDHLSALVLSFLPVREIVADVGFFTKGRSVAVSHDEVCGRRIEIVQRSILLQSNRSSFQAFVNDRIFDAYLGVEILSQLPLSQAVSVSRLFTEDRDRRVEFMQRACISQIRGGCATLKTIRASMTPEQERSIEKGLPYPSFLREITQLEIKGDDIITERLLEALPHLESVKIIDFWVANDCFVVLFATRYPNLKTLKISSRAIIELSAVAVKILTAYRRLEKLYLTQCVVSDESLRLIAQNLPLRVLDISQFITLPQLQFISENCRRLEEITIEYIGTEFLEIILNTVRSLRKAKLGFLCEEISKLISERLPVFMRLEECELNVHNYGHTRIAQLIIKKGHLENVHVKGMAGKQEVQLTMTGEPSLRIRVAPSWHQSDFDNIVQSIIPYCRSLKKIDLHNYYLSDENIRLIVQNNPLLRVFSAIECHLPAVQVHLIAQYCPYLEELVIPENFIAEGAVSLLAQNCLALRILDLGACAGVTDKDIRNVALHCQQLEKLYLSGQQLTEETLDAIVERCPNLQVLDLAYNDMEDSWVIFIVKSCKHLKELNLRNCTGVTLLSLYAILTESQSLEKLNIEEIFTDRDSDRLIQSLREKGIAVRE